MVSLSKEGKLGSVSPLGLKSGCSSFHRLFCEFEELETRNNFRGIECPIQFKSARKIWNNSQKLDKCSVARARKIFATVRMPGFSLKWAFIRRVKRGDMIPWRVETQNVSAVKQKHNLHLGNKN